MKKKILISVVAIVILLGNLVFATETLSPTVDADTLTNTALVGEDNITDQNADKGIMPINETPYEMDSDNSNADGDYSIPPEWARDNNSIFPEAVETNVFEGGEESYTVSNKEINGNAFYASEQLQLSNVIISGDLWIAGKYIDLNDVTVYGNIYIGADNVKITDASISGIVYVACNNVEIAESAFQDIFSASSTLTLGNSSYILRDLNAAAGTINIANTVIARNANLTVDTLNVGEATNIEGALNYSSKAEATIPSNATINNVNYTSIKETSKDSSTIQNVIFGVLSTILKSALVCAFILVFAKSFVEKQKTDKLVSYYLGATAKGALAAILIPVLVFVLLCTGFGIGVGFILLGIYFIIFAISLPVVAVSVATAVTKKMEYNFWKVYGISILIAVVISILQKIVVIGAIITIIVGLLGMGLIFAGLKNKKDRKEEVKEV